MCDSPKRLAAWKAKTPGLAAGAARQDIIGKELSDAARAGICSFAAMAQLGPPPFNTEGAFLLAARNAPRAMPGERTQKSPGS